MAYDIVVSCNEGFSQSHELRLKMATVLGTKSWHWLCVNAASVDRYRWRRRLVGGSFVTVSHQCQSSSQSLQVKYAAEGPPQQSMLHH